MPGSPIRLVIPAYNEAKNLPSLFERIAAALGDASGYRIYAVNDGSSDDTAAVLAELKRSHPLHDLHHDGNKGIATTFLTGLRAALEGTGDDDCVVVLEGDGTSDPALIPAMRDALTGDCDVVIASRYVAGGKYLHFPLKRRILSFGANWLLRAVYRMPGVRDYTVFYRAYRAGPLKRALARYGDRLTSAGGFACNAEMLLRLRSFIRRAREVPLVYDYGLKNGKSSMKIGGNIQSYFTLFRLDIPDRRTR